MVEFKKEQMIVPIRYYYDEDMRECNRKIDKKSIYDLLDTIMERYQLVKIGVIDLKSIDETESQLTFTVSPNLNPKFSKITTPQALLKSVQNLFEFTSELDTIEDYWENQQPKTVEEDWNIVTECLSEEIYDWIKTGGLEWDSKTA